MNINLLAQKWNTDSDPRELEEGEYRNLLNMVPTIDGLSRGFRKETVKGTTAYGPESYPDGVNNCIGAIEDTENDRVFYFLYNSLSNHSIWVFYNFSSTTTKVIEWTGLAFPSDGFIHGGYTDGILVFSDGGTNNIRYLDVERAINTTNALGGSVYPQPWTDEYLSLALRPPMKAVVVNTSFLTDIVQQNNNLYIQFQYRYVYFGGQKSSFSPTSRAYEIPSDSVVNALRVEIPSEEQSKIHSLIEGIELVAKTSNSGTYSVVYTWLRDGGIFPTDGGGNISTTVYNFSGKGIPANEQSVQFSPIPIKPKALCIADRRVFAANFQSRYDYIPPDGYSISFTPKSAGNIISGVEIYDIVYSDTDPPYHDGFLAAQIGSRWYRVVLDGLEYDILGEMPYLKEDIGFGNATATLNTTGDVRFFSEDPVFKKNARYRLGIIFFDKYGRPSNPVSKPEWEVDIDTPNRNIQFAITTNIFDPSVSPIPEWAHHYKIVCSKASGIGYFFNTWSSQVYYQDNIIEENPEKSGGAYNKQKFFFIDLENYVSSGYGYTYTEGDRVRFRMGTSDYDLPIAGSIGTAIYVEAKDFGTITHNTQFRVPVEVYSPSSFDENILYETGDAYAITAPETANRDYSVKVGSITGDCYLVQRDIFLVNGNRSVLGGAPISYIGYYQNQPYKSYHQSPVSEGDFRATAWNTFHGNPYPIQRQYDNKYIPNGYAFSQRYVDRQNNSLSKWLAFDRDTLEYERGQINRLVRTVDSGTVVLCVHERACTSLYVGRGYVETSEGGGFLSKSSNVVGDDRRLKYSYGTVHPESVVEWDGSVYFFDANRGEAVRYSNNGLTPLSTNFRISSYTQGKGREWKAGRHAKVVACFDDRLKLVFWSFDDETIAFDELTNAWIGRFSWVCEASAKVSNRLLTFKSAIPYIHNEASQFARFYGTVYESILEFEVYGGLPEEKIWRHIALFCNERVDAILSNDAGQQTDILATEFNLRDSESFYGEFRKDANTDPSVIPAGGTALNNGLPMRSAISTIKLILRIDQTVENNRKLIFNQGQIGFHPQRGHRIFK